MKYQTFLKIIDLKKIIGDWERDMINDRELLEKVRDCYAELEKEAEPRIIKEEEL